MLWFQVGQLLMSPGGSAKPDTFTTINDDIPRCQRDRAAGVCPYVLADELLNRAAAGVCAQIDLIKCDLYTHTWSPLCKASKMKRVHQMPTCFCCKR